ncbi:hypothetical protein [Rheinheimera sp. NSM]|uniref:hypothetical protein n=1 Tax=Rheinheimera sp. NSM TaxID=3457884 RepID=UPI004036EE3D
MLLHILSTIISLGIMAVCLYFAIMIDAKYQDATQSNTSRTGLAKVALYKTLPLAGACIMAIKAVHFPVSYLMASAVFSCIFVYEFFRLKVSTNT